MTLEEKRRHSAPRVRGYHIFKETDSHYEGTGPVIWAQEPEIPPEWETTKQDPTVKRASLIRSGRKFASYHRS